jgi:hypothetical protein
MRTTPRPALSPQALLEKAEALESWSESAPEPLGAAYRRRAGALRLLASLQGEYAPAA